MRDATAPTTNQTPRPTYPTRPTDEIVSLGLDIYERDIRPQVEANHVGQIVAIDVDSGRWAIGDEVLEAVDRLRTQRPEAINILSERVGFPSLDKFGAWPLRRPD